MKKFGIFLFTFLLIVLFVGCRTDEYRQFVNDYKKTYYSIADNIDISKTYDSLERLQSDEVTINMNHMKSILDDIDSKITDSRRRQQYTNFCKYYEGLKFLRDSFENWGKLTQDERGRIDIEMIWVGMMKSNKDHSDMW